MDAKRLAAKQKRYQDWSKFFSTELKDPSLQPEVHAQLSSYRHLLAEVWKSGVTDALTSKIDSVERDLERLNHEARVRVPGRGK